MNQSPDVSISPKSYIAIIVIMIFISLSLLLYTVVNLSEPESSRLEALEAHAHAMTIWRQNRDNYLYLREEGVQSDVLNETFKNVQDSLELVKQTRAQLTEEWKLQ